MKIFKNKDALNSKWIPPKEIILYRDQQIEELSCIYDCLNNGETPENVICYGKSGTGKTVVNCHLKIETEKMINNRIDSKIIYLKCDRLTEFQALVKIATSLGSSAKGTRVNYYDVIEKLIKNFGIKTIIIFDEIEKIIKKYGDNILFTFSRFNEELIGKSKGRLGLILITNDLSLTNYIRPSTLSSLSSTQLIFPPYNALQLQDILKKRAELSFNKGVLEEGVIEKCSALSAQEHGDARRAIDLLRVAGEIAEKKGTKISVDNVDKAEKKIDYDIILEMVRNQPKQSQIVLYSILRLSDELQEIQTGDVYDSYLKYCKLWGIRPLSQRRISDLISELDMYGIINAKTLSKGRYGVSRTINLGFSENYKEKLEIILQERLI